MSTQFVKIHEIGTEAPSIRSVETPHKKDPLNLVLAIHPRKIEIRTGLQEKLLKTISFSKEESHLSWGRGW